MVPAGETHPDAQMLARILELAGIEMILVGGQALAFWAAYYSVPASPICRPEPLLHIKSFAARKLPQLLKLMSAQRQAQVTAATK